MADKTDNKEPKPPPPNKKTVIIFSVNDVYDIKNFGRMHQFIKVFTQQLRDDHFPFLNRKITPTMDILSLFNF